MYITQVLADYVQSQTREALSPEAREGALRCILDLMAAAVAGFPVQSTARARQVAPMLFGEGTAAIWLSDLKTTLPGAVFCNAAAASALDLDDGHRLARGHPGAAVIPAAFAVAAETDATADQLLGAIAVGYQVAVGVAAARGSYARSGMWCGFGAVAAAGYLRHTPPEQLSHALAIAGMTAPNLLSVGDGSSFPAPLGNDVKEGIAWATANAVTALCLAEAGLTGPLDMLDHAPHYARQKIADSLAGSPAICSTYFKPFCCCRHVHAPVDALEALILGNALSPREIVAVEVYTYGGALRLSNRPEPENLIDVQYSIPYCLGLAALVGSDAFLPLEEAVLNRLEVTAFARKVSLHLDPEIDNRFPAESLARVVVKTATASFESPLTAPRGEASNPLSWQDLQGKFRHASRRMMTSRQQQDLLDAVGRLREGDLVTLRKILQRPLGC
ncbi:MmgE/PrpD family protein [Pelagibius litoralis]|uniref:MmgE/PrpD family protein n=1 Tax=Pelagibius litoralis TaxID=374515 RepID=A0A967F1T0_9PROT|nr:MmgE/PrpD family protein [Pelagibius litoralis]NIA71417.1 MmgE/PrpD family protein [Pelagibius litoralis]